jgi:hypothetical protein
MTAFDREALSRLLDEYPEHNTNEEHDELLERILALASGSSQAGMCGNSGPGRNVLCQLRAGHPGWHEGKDYEALQPGVVGFPHIAHWGQAWTEHGQQANA